MYGDLQLDFPDPTCGSPIVTQRKQQRVPTLYGDLQLDFPEPTCGSPIVTQGKHQRVRTLYGDLRLDLPDPTCGGRVSPTTTRKEPSLLAGVLFVSRSGKR